MPERFTRHRIEVNRVATVEGIAAEERGARGRLRERKRVVGMGGGWVIVERTRFDRVVGWRSVAEERALARVRAISFTNLG